MEGWDCPPQQKQTNKNNKQTNINGNYKIGNHLPPSQSNCLLFVIIYLQVKVIVFYL